MKTQMRYHLTPISVAIIKKSTNNKSWRWCGEKMNPPTLLVAMQIYIATMENRILSKTRNTVTIFSSTILGHVF